MRQVVRQDAKVGGDGACAGDQRSQHRSVGVVNLAFGECGAGTHDLVARGDDGHPQSREAPDVGDAERSQCGHVLWAKNRAGRQHGCAGCHILPGLSDVGAGSQTSGNGDGGPPLHGVDDDILLHDNGIVPPREHGPRENADSGFALWRGVEGMSGRGAPGHGQDAAFVAIVVGGGKRKTVNRGIRVRRHRQHRSY